MKNRVRELREAAELSQADFGRILGVSRQTVSAIEQGRWDPSLPLAMNIALLFKTTVEEVFTLENARVVSL